MERREFLKRASWAPAFAAVGLRPPAVFAQSAMAIGYNCSPGWGGWAGQFTAMRSRLGITVPPDNKNSGQALAALIAEKNKPVADFVYLGGQVGPQAQAAGVLAPFKPARFNAIPADLKDADGHWFAVHSGTLGLMVNSAALGKTPLPTRWQDLAKPEYKGLIGYLDPTSAAVGQLTVVAVNLALGGSYSNLAPGIEFFKALKKNDPIVPKVTAYSRVLSGEIPILVDFDFNAYRARYEDKAAVDFIIPQEGTRNFPYVMALIKNGPNIENGKKVLDFLLSDPGQAQWANGYLRPVFPEAMSQEAKSKFLPDAEYARASPTNLMAMAAASPEIVKLYQKNVE